MKLLDNTPRLAAAESPGSRIEGHSAEPSSAEGQTDEIENFPLQICPSVSSMNVRRVRSGTGIPGFSGS